MVDTIETDLKQMQVVTHEKENGYGSKKRDGFFRFTA